MVSIRGMVRSLRRKPNNPYLRGVQDASASTEEKLQKYNKAMEEERSRQVRMHEFESLVARRTHMVEDKKALKEAAKKLEEILKLELHPNLAKNLAAYIANGLGHEVIEQLFAQGKLKEFLVASSALKANIMSLKAGKRIQKNLFEASVEDLKEQLKQMQEG